MDARHFDALSRALSAGDSRRRLLALLATLPLLGGLIAVFDPEDADGKGRRKRRKKRHKHGKLRRRKHKQTQCKAQPDSQTCAGKCGSVTNTCKKAVDCGSCDCSPACGECFTCQGAAGSPGTCVPQDAGTPCGAAATCVDGVVSPQARCDGSGSCEPADPVPCSPYTQCVGNACATSCSGDGDCVAGSFCNGSNQCVGDGEDGQPCLHGGQCGSGFCANGVCCNTACNGACEACDLGPATGTCTTLGNGSVCGLGQVCCGGSCVECCADAQCPDPTEPICVAGACTACTANPAQCPSGRCCASDGSCAAGTANAACGSSGTCAVCTPPQTCGGGGAAQVCGCTPITTCPAGKNCGVYPDGCGGQIDCGSCSQPTPICVDNVCTCTSTAQCNSGFGCISGSCQPCAACATCATSCASCNFCAILTNGTIQCIDGGFKECERPCNTIAQCRPTEICVSVLTNKHTGYSFSVPGDCGTSAAGVCVDVATFECPA